MGTNGVSLDLEISFSLAVGVWTSSQGVLETLGVVFILSDSMLFSFISRIRILRAGQLGFLYSHRLTNQFEPEGYTKDITLGYPYKVKDSGRSC